MSNSSSGCYIIDDDYNVVSVNDVASRLYPSLKAGKKCYRCLLGLDEPCGPCPVANGIKGPRTYIDPIRGISETVDAVEFPMEGHGICHALIFSTVTDCEAGVTTLPETTGERPELIKALTADFIDVFTVNLDTDTVVVYRHNGESVENGSEYKLGISYTEALKRFALRYVTAPDSAMLMEKTGIEGLRAYLMDHESMNVRYNVKLNGVEQRYFRRIVRVGDAADFRNVVIGVGRDELYKETRLLEERLNAVEYDSLTGLYTREAFAVHGGELIRNNPDKHFDYCVLKLDGVSGLNHQYGNNTVDKLLTLIGGELAKYRNSGNCIAYIGAGQFASLTETQQREERRKAAYAFRDMIREASGLKDISLKWAIYVDIPVGISFDELNERVLYALSTVRFNQRHDYAEFDKRMLDGMRREEDIVDRFESALANGEFKVYYQPKFSIKTGDIVGAEALVRWHRPDGTAVNPSEFIPVLEKNGLIVRLDEYMFSSVCVFQRSLWDKHIHTVPISVNLSRASMFTVKIAEEYSKISADCGIAPAYVPIEITESAAVRSLNIRNFADELIGRGFPIHMDDFGTGYSSLSSLQMIPFESIKLDKSLIDFIGTPGGEGLLRHTVAFAKESGKNVVAEGVETKEQYKFLRDIDCDQVQGFLFARPMTQDEFEAKLSQTGD